MRTPSGSGSQVLRSGWIVLYLDIKEARAALDRPVVAIGNFDGLHRGHQALLEQVVDLADQAGASPAVLTFEPHPVRFFRPDVPPFRLTTNQQRAALLAQVGIAGTYAATFDTPLVNLSPTEFVDQILHHGLNASAVVVGEGFVFGKSRAGNTDLLTELCEARGIQTHIISQVSDGEVISSTRIREAVRNNDFATATRLLGHPFALVGNVVHGDARGRNLGFPTANIAVENELLPNDGIFATILHDPEHGAMLSATYVGTRPTFDGESRAVEAFVLDREDLDLYDRYLTLEFVGHIRGDRAFDSPEALVAQMKEDIEAARKILGSSSR